MLITDIKRVVEQISRDKGIDRGILIKALEEALREDDEAIVERYIKGTEVTCGLLQLQDDFTVFPITEIIPKNEFFDYEAKYMRGKAEEITPANISDELTRQCQSMAKAVYKLTDCSGIIRVDFIIKGNQIYFLELNSIPGMSQESIIPQQVEKAGIKWHGRFPWDWHAHVGFAPGYTPDEREKLVDVYMHDFHDIFGCFPKSVGSWPCCRRRSL